MSERTVDRLIECEEKLAAAEKRIAETEHDLGQALLRQDDEIDHLKARIAELEAALRARRERNLDVVARDLWHENELNWLNGLLGAK